MTKHVFIQALSTYLLLFSVFAVGCNKDVANNTVTPTLPVAKDKKFLALGDSYTIGQGVAAEQRFPAQTVTLLRQAGIKINDPQYIAATGWTTQNLSDAIAQQNPQPGFDVVTLLIGVNDQYQGMDTAGYRLRFSQLLTKAIELAGGKQSHVFVLSIPDYSVTPFVSNANKLRVRTEIDQFNNINLQVTQQKNVSYLNITPSTREAENDASLIATDGLHPSGKEYKKWAEQLAPIIKAVL